MTVSWRTFSGGSWLLTRPTGSRTETANYSISSKPLTWSVGEGSVCECTSGCGYCVHWWPMSLLGSVSIHGNIEWAMVLVRFYQSWPLILWIFTPPPPHPPTPTPHTGAPSLIDGHSLAKQCGGTVQFTQLPGAEHLHLSPNLPTAVWRAQDRGAGWRAQGGESCDCLLCHVVK